jgi:hypothetical protein
MEDRAGEQPGDPRFGGHQALPERPEWEFIGQNALFTSIIAGGIFLFGLILTGTMADYKESEKIPAEIASSCREFSVEAYR